MPLLQKERYGSRSVTSKLNYFEDLDQQQKQEIEKLRRLLQLPPQIEIQNNFLKKVGASAFLVEWAERVFKEAKEVDEKAKVKQRAGKKQRKDEKGAKEESESCFPFDFYDDDDGNNNSNDDDEWAKLELEEELKKVLDPHGESYPYLEERKVI